MALNPCLYRRLALPQVIKHGQLRCTNQNYRVLVVNSNENSDNRQQFRLWNRDLAICFNMLPIVIRFVRMARLPKSSDAMFLNTQKGQENLESVLMTYKAND
ncbi:hypothetical protein G6F57_003947 [Rhizopus arrhizus]|nr:hypothetical protein G6F21_003778 [Rhizopus arrhizus]KAG1425800.1 hypothetical protein G6F58_001778 [Rhizopus delemar]KAG0801426.1 hypothetical protein G6F22_001257 [Rhizopus arrhizus]KAG0817632.1 hypothetical protein G6F20_002222 [Rhizopus arrhizus]KAG0835561.1 hypothetical protein G6F19_004663 [Rhizopus arrhizus]